MPLVTRKYCVTFSENDCGTIRNNVKLNGIFAGYQFVLSQICLCLVCFSAHRLDEIDKDNMAARLKLPTVPSSS